MPSNPPTVADLEQVVAYRCGAVLQEVGTYLTSPDGTTPSIREGLRRGCKAVVLTISNPLVLADSDTANLSGFATERVIDEAELFAMEEALVNWWRLCKKHMEAVSATPILSGWLVELKQSVKNRISQLKAICDEPYREPSDPMVVVGHFGETHPSVAPGQYPVTVSPLFTGQGFITLSPWAAGYLGGYYGWERGYGYGDGGHW